MKRNYIEKAGSHKSSLGTENSPVKGDGEHHCLHLLHLLRGGWSSVQVFWPVCKVNAAPFQLIA